MAPEAPAPAPPTLRIDRRLREVAAGFDIAAVIVLGWAISVLAPIAFWQATGFTTVVYHALSFALLGCSPAARLLDIILSAYAQEPRCAAVPVVRWLLAINDRAEGSLATRTTPEWWAAR